MNPKLTASEVGRLIYPPGDFSRPRNIKKGLQIHKELGYDNRMHFRKSYRYKGNKWRIGGVPDKIDDGTIYELKTYFGGTDLDGQKNRGYAQLVAYLYISGYPYGELHLYNSLTDEFSDPVQVPYDKNEIESTLNKAIDLKSTL